MHSFKEYFQLFLERQLFAKNVHSFGKIVDIIYKKLNSIPKIKNGETFSLGGKLKIGFYLNPPKYIPDKLKDAHAMYYPYDTTIYVFLNNMYGTKVKNKLEYIKQMPSELRDYIQHELTHAQEHLLRKAADKETSVLQFTGPENPDIEDEDERYINNLAEMNAYLQQWVSREFTDNRAIRTQLQRGNLNNATLLLVQKIKREPHFNNLYDKNKKWFFKTIYTTLDQLMNK